MSAPEKAQHQRGEIACQGKPRPFITHSADIRQILDHIGVQAESAHTAPARGPPLREGGGATFMKIGPLMRLGGRITAANVAFDDHHNAKRFSDRSETVTVDSVFTRLARAGLASMPQKLVLQR